MKKLNVFIVSILMLQLSSCYDVSEEIGFLSDHISLKGADTIPIPLGGKGSTDVAWLDGSTQPVEFTIENVRDVDGNRSNQFFEKLLYQSWLQPYNYETDTTMELIRAKLGEFEWESVMLNPVNGQILYTETTSNLRSPGDIFHLDVKVKNYWGEKIYKDYAILKLTSETQPFKFFRSTVAILLVNDAGDVTFTLYDYIAEDDLDRHQKIYDRTGEELIDIYKKSDEPSTGIKVIIQYFDSKGNLFDPKDYETYSGTTQSYLDHAVNRENTEEGVSIEFPTTPWPADQGLLSYLKGATLDFGTLDTASLHQDVYINGTYPYLYEWPEDEWGASKWYIRLRSKIVFYESGTWVISCRFPYTHIDGNFE